MKQMKQWANYVCPCCQQVSEITNMHLYLCPHLTVAIAREESFYSILNWLETVHTDSLMIEFITASWHGENLSLDPECPQDLKPIYNTSRDIGLHRMWLGLLPVGMVEYQANYYLQIGSRQVLLNWV